jgi:DNA polymerase V
MMQAVDSLNQYYGRNTVQFASSGIGKRWKMLQVYKSPCFTTCWGEIPVVNARDGQAAQAPILDVCIDFICS